MAEPNPYLDPEEENNYVEAHIIIQEFHDDPTIFVVGSAPFGKIWFDRARIQKQYDVLSRDWEEEYGGKVVTHSKKPRIVRVLLEEKDVIFPDDVEVEINGVKVEPTPASKKDTDSDSDSVPKQEPEPEPINEVIQTQHASTIHTDPTPVKKTRAKKEPKEPKTPKKAKEPKTMKT